MTPALLSPLTLAGLTLKNRAVVSPMCQYSAKGGLADDWHFAHLGRFALGGFGLVMAEATAVTAEGRISYGDLGLWTDAQEAALARIAGFLNRQGAAAGIQIGHAGRKASSPLMWRGSFDETEAEKPEVGFEDWPVVGPSPLSHAPDNPDYKQPRELTAADLDDIEAAFARTATRADCAGFDVVEVHAAHGYLLHQFLSPVANRRGDAFGGSRENRMRFPLRVIAAVRAVWPASKPLFLRISVRDGIEGGWDVADAVAFATEAKALGVTLVDCSSGGFTGGRIEVGPGYQVPLARAVRDGAGLPVMAVGLITGAEQAEAIVAAEDADLVALGRAALDDPNWPLHAARTLGAEDAYAGFPRQAAFAVRAKDRALGQGGFARAAE